MISEPFGTLQNGQAFLRIADPYRSFLQKAEGMMKSPIWSRANAKAAIGVFMLGLYLAGCRNLTPEQASTLAPQALASMTEAPRSAASAASSPTAIPSQTPLPPTSTYTPIPTSAWKAGWIDFINGYYGYAISLPPAAQIQKNEEVTSYDPQELPADWNPKDSYFDYLNMTYPPGLCTLIEYQHMLIKITAPDSLGGRYSPECKSFGGLGEGHWTWNEEEVIVGEKAFIATVLGRCETDAPDAKCATVAYGIPMGDQGQIVIHGDVPILFEILSTYRPAPKTELYCPEPAPTRLEEGQSAYVSTGPLLAYSNVREGPGINQALIGKIESGKIVELLEGPVCNNSLQWWKVRVAGTKLEGWTPEGDHTTYWLNPCESKDDCMEG